MLAQIKQIFCFEWLFRPNICEVLRKSHIEYEKLVHFIGTDHLTNAETSVLLDYLYSQRMHELKQIGVLNGKNRTF